MQQPGPAAGGTAFALRTPQSAVQKDARPARWCRLSADFCLHQATNKAAASLPTQNSSFSLISNLGPIFLVLPIRETEAPFGELDHGYMGGRGGNAAALGAKMQQPDPIPICVTVLLYFTPRPG